MDSHTNENMVPTPVTRKSPISREEHTRIINLNPIVLAKYEAGEGLIQDLFPYLSAEDREFIMSGITPEEWNNLFGEEDSE
jgi:hypothetical protein